MCVYAVSALWILYFLRSGVDVDCVNHLGQTSLFCASLLGFGAVAELLLQYGADPNRYDHAERAFLSSSTEYITQHGYIVKLCT